MPPGACGTPAAAEEANASPLRRQTPVHRPLELGYQTPDAHNHVDCNVVLPSAPAFSWQCIPHTCCRYDDANMMPLSAQRPACCCFCSLDAMWLQDLLMQAAPFSRSRRLIAQPADRRLSVLLATCNKMQVGSSQRLVDVRPGKTREMVPRTMFACPSCTAPRMRMHLKCSQMVRAVVPSSMHTISVMYENQQCQ